MGCVATWSADALNISMAQITVGTLIKDPQETRTFKMDWSAHLGTEKIASSSWTLPDGLTHVANGIVTGNNKTYITISSGTAGNTYIVTNTIHIANSNDIYERSGTLVVRQY